MKEARSSPINRPVNNKSPFYRPERRSSVQTDPQMKEDSVHWVRIKTVALKFSSRPSSGIKFRWWTDVHLFNKWIIKHRKLRVWLLMWIIIDVLWRHKELTASLVLLDIMTIRWRLTQSSIQTQHFSKPLTRYHGYQMICMNRNIWL